MSLITVNGQRWQARYVVGLSELIDRLHYADKRLAIELNGQAITTDNYVNTYFTDGDRIKIVAVGGG